MLHNSTGVKFHSQTQHIMPLLLTVNVFRRSFDVPAGGCPIHSLYARPVYLLHAETYTECKHCC